MKGLVCFRHGLSANTVEKFLRIGLAYALSQMMGLRSDPENARCNRCRHREQRAAAAGP